MKKHLILLAPLALMILPSCGMNQLVNESTQSIYCNIQAVERSTEVVNENRELINASTRVLEENKRSLESMGE